MLEHTRMHTIVYEILNALTAQTAIKPPCEVVTSEWPAEILSSVLPRSPSVCVQLVQLVSV